MRRPLPSQVRSRSNGAENGFTSSRQLSSCDDRPGVGDLEGRPPLAHTGPGADPAVRPVVAERVLEQVGDEPLDHRLVARRARVAELRVDPEPVRLGAALDDLGGDRAQIDRRARLEPALAAGERQQRLDQPLLLLAGREHALAGTRAATRPRRSGSASATSTSARSSVIGVRSSCEALATNRRWDSNAAPAAPSSPSKVSAELLELVVGRLERQALVQVVLGDATGPGAHRAQRRSARPAISQPSPIETSAMIAERDRRTRSSSVEQLCSARRCDHARWPAACDRARRAEVSLLERRVHLARVGAATGRLLPMASSAWAMTCRRPSRRRDAALPSARRARSAAVRHRGPGWTQYRLDSGRCAATSP